MGCRWGDRRQRTRPRPGRGVLQGDRKPEDTLMKRLCTLTSLWLLFHTVGYASAGCMKAASQSDMPRRLTWASLQRVCGSPWGRTSTAVFIVRCHACRRRVWKRSPSWRTASMVPCDAFLAPRPPSKCNASFEVADWHDFGTSLLQGHHTSCCFVIYCVPGTRRLINGAVSRHGQQRVQFRLQTQHDQTRTDPKPWSACNMSADEGCALNTCLAKTLHYF